MILVKMDHGMPSFRKTKGDKKAKRRYRFYKRGGKYRSMNVKISERKI